MRDPERIDRIVDGLRTYWKAHPDLRLCQIVGNFLRWYWEAPYPTPPDMTGRAYNTEDDGFERYLRTRNERQP